MPEDDTTATTPPPDHARDHISHYKILEKIGEGGMGIVYLADQEHPIRRRVALKVIKQGMDTKHVIARFEAERQALALMDHPNVAKVFEAGATAEGRPYFVMEYVPGVPITEHCDRHRLTTKERLEIFTQVCDGVQHAHQKAIIHRDLKPSNILVSVQEGRAVPKIIDFGVAKATAQPLTERTLFTELGVLIGTPEYMSPEQAERTAQDVDTRTDVYSLGVVFYELLVGALPFESSELRSAGLDGVRQIIREKEPPRPSTRLATLGHERSTETAARRRVDRSTLERQISGDLDWIALKALEKDRSRRYGSPAELATDIRRHLADEAVIARPPAVMYRFRKLLRRHRRAFAVAGLVVAALVIGLATTTMMFVRARRAEHSAISERDAAARSSYLANLRAAQLALRAHESGDAKRYLAACNVRDRGWEWDYLGREASSEIASVEGTEPRFSPDSRVLTTFSEKSRILRWDTSSFTRLDSPAKNANSASVLDDADRIITASRDGSRVLVLRQEEKSGSDQGPGFAGSVRSVDLNSGASTVLGAFQATSYGNISFVLAWQFSPNGARVACVGDTTSRSVVSVFDTHTGARVTTITIPGGSNISDVAFSPGGDRLAIAQGDGSVMVWKIETRGASQSWEAKGVRDIGASAIAFDRAGDALAIGYFTGEIDLRSDASGVLLHTWRGHESSVSSLDFSAQDDTLASGAYDKTVRRWSRSSNKAIATWNVGTEPGRVRASPDGGMLAAVGRDGRTKVWRTDTTEPIRLDSNLSAISLSPDGNALTYGTFNCGVTILDVVRRKPTARFRGQIPVGSLGGYTRAGNCAFVGDYLPIYAVKFTPDGRQVISGDAKGNLRRHDARTAEVLSVVSPTTSAIMALDVSADGRWAAFATRRGDVFLVDVAQNGPVQRLQEGDGHEVLALAFSPDGRRIAWGGDSRVELFDLATRTTDLSIKTSKDVISLAFDPRGTQLAGGFRERGEAELLTIWDSRSGMTLALFSGRPGGDDIQALSFSSDGRRLVAGGQSGVVYDFRTEPFELLVSLELGDSVEALNFTPNGQRLICGLRGGFIAILEGGRVRE